MAALQAKIRSLWSRWDNGGSPCILEEIVPGDLLFRGRPWSGATADARVPSDMAMTYTPGRTPTSARSDSWIVSRPSGRLAGTAREPALKCSETLMYLSCTPVPALNLTHQRSLPPLRASRRQQVLGLQLAGDGPRLAGGVSKLQPTDTGPSLGSSPSPQRPGNRMSDIGQTQGQGTCLRLSALRRDPRRPPQLVPGPRREANCLRVARHKTLQRRQYVQTALPVVTQAKEDLPTITPVTTHNCFGDRPLHPWWIGGTVRLPGAGGTPLHLTPPPNARNTFVTIRAVPSPYRS